MKLSIEEKKVALEAIKYYMNTLSSDMPYLEEKDQEELGNKITLLQDVYLKLAGDDYCDHIYDSYCPRCGLDS